MSDMNEMNDDDTVTRAYLMNIIYKKFGYSRAESADLVDTVIDEINKGLEDKGEVKISSFGTFKVRQKKQRVGRNPKTKQEVPISARKVVSFYASNLLKKRINGQKTESSGTKGGSSYSY